MADVVSPEVQVRAIVKESGAPPAPIQPIVDSLRKTLDNKSAEAALRLAANRDVDKAKINFAINENIGITRNEDGTKDIPMAYPPSAEAARKTRAEDAGRIAGDLIEKGYDRLAAGDQVLAQTAVLKLIDTYPTFQSVLGPLGAPPYTGAQLAFAERMLKDPAYKEQVVNGLRNLVDTTNVNTDSIMQLQKEFTVADAEVGRIGGEITAVEGKIDTINTAIQEHQVDVVTALGPPPTYRRGLTYQRIADLNTEINGFSTAATDAKNEITTRERRLRDLTEERQIARKIEIGSMAPRAGVTYRSSADIDREIAPIETEIQDRKNTIEDAQREITLRMDQRKSLLDEKAQLDDRLTKQREKKSELDAQKSGKQTIKDEKEKALAKAKADQTFKEEEFVKGLENALAEAAAAHINRQVEITATEGVTILDKQAAEAKDKREKVVLDDFRERYFNNNKVDRDEIREDFNELMSNGPDNIIRNSLVASGMTAAQVTEAMNDTEYMDKMRKDVGKKVMGFHLLRGGFLGRNGRISADESLMIKNSPWGEQIINDAIKGNKDWQEELKKQMGSGIISGGGRLSENLRNMSTGRLISLLLLIFGGGLAALTFGPAAIGAAGGAVATIMPK